MGQFIDMAYYMNVYFLCFSEKLVFSDEEDENGEPTKRR